MKLILTSNGFENKRIGEKFVSLLRVTADKAKVLFVPTAAIDDEARAVLPKCKNELIESGIMPNNIVDFNCDRYLTIDEAKKYDVLYFAGGSPPYLYKQVCAIGLDKVIKTSLELGAVYVGASAGSVLACKPYLSFFKKRIWPHAPTNNKGQRWPLFFPVKIKDFQAIIIDDEKIELFE